MAFFYSVFLNKAQTASIMGYLLSIWVTLVAITLNATLFTYPTRMSWWLLLYPTFPYVRVFYHLTVACTYTVCVSQFKHLDSEASLSIGLLYVEAVVFLLLALYLQQVIPQTYGVRKHPLFLCRDMCRKKRNVADLEAYEEIEEEDRNRDSGFDNSKEDGDA